MVVSDTRVVETDEDAAKVLVTIALAARSTLDVTVIWTTAAFGPRPSGAAVPGADYLERSGTTVIPAGSLHARVPLWVRGDEVPEDFLLIVQDASAPSSTARGG